jgi:citrate synthase
MVLRVEVSPNNNRNYSNPCGCWGPVIPTQEYGITVSALWPGPLVARPYQAVSEAGIYGGRPNIRSINFFLRTKNALDKGRPLQEIIEQELKKYRNIYGYGRPIVNGDERLAPMLKRAEELNLADGPYTKIAFEVEQILLQGRWRMRMNITGLCAALSADQGLSEREHFMFTAPCFTAGIVPCFIEAYERQEGTFLPIRCDRIQYEGTTRRRWQATDH